MASADVSLFERGAGVTMRLPEDAQFASSCALATEWTEVPLLRATPYNHDSVVFSFGLPEGTSLRLPVCACVLLRGVGADGAMAVRPYTPISDDSVLGRFDLLVKVYEQGAVSQYLANLPLGEYVGFKHIPFNIKMQYPFGKRSITMVAGGTGIAPMYQALQSLVGTEGDATERITLLFGNRSPADILLLKELAELEARSRGRLRVVHVVGERPDQPPIDGWKGELGWVDEAKFIKYRAGEPADDTLVMVCGLPVLYDVFCGPRTEKELREGSVLQRLGYTESMVAKF